MSRRRLDRGRIRLSIVVLLFLLLGGALVLALGQDPNAEPADEGGPVSMRALGFGAPRLNPAVIAADGQVQGPAEFVARARKRRSDGKTFLVRGGEYGELDLRGIGRRRLTTFRAYPGERPVIEAVLMGDTTNIRLEGLRFEGPIDIQPGENSGIELVGNDIGGYRGVGVNVREHSTDILIQGNRFHDLTQLGGDYAAGYGVRTSSPEVRIARVKIVGNTFERLGNDAMELGGVDGLLVAGNEVSEVQIEPGSDAHSDPLFLWAGSRRVTVRRNRFYDNSQPVYIRGDLERVVFENNLVAGSENYCMQVGGKGPPGDAIDGLVIRNNTIWDCGFGGLLFSGASRGWTLVNNLVESIHAGPPVSRFDRQAFNLIGNDRPGGRDLPGRPRFEDRAGGDYRLAPGSPGIDAAWSSEAPKRDLLGQSRWDDPEVRNRGRGRAYDVGAYERRSG